MAYGIAAGSIMAVSAVGTMNGQETITTVHYRYANLTGTIPDGRAAIMTVLAAIRLPDGWFSKYLDCMSSTVKNVQLYGQWITNTRYAYATDGEPALDGDIAGDAMPQNVAMVVTRRGDLADRHNISTLHLPGVPLDFVVNGNLTDDAIAALEEFANATLQDFVLISGQELKPCAFRRSDPPVSRMLTEAFAQRTVRVMRRRTVGLGS